jgi:hypothetical protein
MTNKDEIDELRKELKELKSSIAPTVNDEAAMRQWRDQQHQNAERRAAAAPPFSRADLEAFEAAAPTSVVRDIAMRDARGPLTPCSPGAVPPSTTNVRGPVGTGWREATKLGPVPGIALVDRLLELDSARQRGEAMVSEARRKAAEKASD